jgi:3-oxoadipate enol-lactonase
VSRRRAVTETTATVGRAASAYDWHLPTGRWIDGRTVDLPERGGSMYVQEAGRGNAKTIVLLHGWTASGPINWPAETVHALARDHHVLVVNHRGHNGGMAWPPAEGVRNDGYLETAADDVVGPGGVLDAFGVDEAQMIGYSMGGPIAMLAARRHPDRVTDVVAEATAAWFPEARLFAPLIKAGTLAVAAVPALTPVPVPSVVRKVPVLREVAELLGGSFRGKLAAGLALDHFDARPWVGDTGKEFSVVLTQADQLVPVRSQRELADLTRARIFSVANLGGHAVPGSNVREFTAQTLAASRDVSRRTALRRAREMRAQRLDVLDGGLAVA